ncbi:MAG TPA: ATP-binding protein [Candidatus Tyrphobacter sp.]
MRRAARSPIRWWFDAADAMEALCARRAFVSWLRATCAPASDFGAAEIVFGELIANVVRHAPGAIRIVAEAHARGSVVLTVCDTGPGFASVPAAPPHATSENGRGLYIVSRLAGKLKVTRSEDGHRVSVVLPVTAIQSVARVELSAVAAKPYV